MRRLALCMLLIGLLAVAPTADAGFLGGFGSRITSTQESASVPIVSSGPNSIVFVDDDSDGILDKDEPVFLSKGTGTLESNAIVLSGPNAGTRLASTSSRVGQTTIDISANLGFVEDNGDGKLTPGELVVVEANDASTGRVSTHDLILSGPDRGTWPSASHNLFNAPLIAVTGPLGFGDRDNDNSFDTNENGYIDVNLDNYASPGDIRLGNQAGQHGAYVKATDADATLYLRDASAAIYFTALDSDGDALLDQDETMYLTVATDKTRSGSIRLYNPPVGLTGDAVRSGDPDMLRTVTLLSGSLATTGSGGAIGASDFLVYDQGDGQSGTGSTMDIVLSGPQAGRRASDVSGVMNVPLTSVSGSVRYLDMDNDGRYTLGDVPFYDGDGNNRVSQGDVQLSVHPNELSNPSSGSTNTQTSSTTTTTSTTQTTSTTTTTTTTATVTQTSSTATETPSETETQTTRTETQTTRTETPAPVTVTETQTDETQPIPGVAVAFVLVALAALAIVRRRL